MNRDQNRNKMKIDLSKESIKSPKVETEQQELIEEDSLDGEI